MVKYKAGDDQRSSHFDDLLSAEDKAKKSAKGMHSTKGNTGRRIADLAGDVNKSKQFKEKTCMYVKTLISSHTNNINNDTRNVTGNGNGPALIEIDAGLHFKRAGQRLLPNL